MLNTLFLYHTTGDPCVYFNGVLVGKDLGDEDALPAF